MTSLKSLNSLSLRKVPSHSHKLKRYCNYQYSLAVQRSHPIPSFRFECSKLIWMVLAIPGRSVGSYWTPVGGHGRSLGGYEILVMGGYIWGYFGDISGDTWWISWDILGISRKQLRGYLRYICGDFFTSVLYRKKFLHMTEFSARVPPLVPVTNMKSDLGDIWGISWANIGDILAMSWDIMRIYKGYLGHIWGIS